MSLYRPNELGPQIVTLLNSLVLKPRRSLLINTRSSVTVEQRPRSQVDIFVPPCEKFTQRDISVPNNFVFNSKKLFVLTGAGLSTESGIPDYRSEHVGLFARSSSRPVQHQDFIKYSNVRKRYWARNFIGWPRFSNILPNIAHKIIANWEALGIISCLVTQNVDRLHTKAGTSSKNVIELHGTTHRVICLQCNHRMLRHELQPMLEQTNPEFVAEALSISPDGDVDIDPSLTKIFKEPTCPVCTGILKPDVIFFGDNVPRSTVNLIYSLISNCDALLIAGSSTQTYSAYRLVLRANELKLPIAIINIGPTRSDHLALLKISARCGDVFPLLRNIQTLHQ